jgi:hypothetical protein
MLEVANDKLTDRERECVKHIRQARERGMSFAEYCRSAGLKANEWHGVRHGMVKKKLLPPGAGSRPKSVRSGGKLSRFIPGCAWSPPVARDPRSGCFAGCVIRPVVSSSVPVGRNSTG